MPQTVEIAGNTQNLTIIRASVRWLGEEMSLKSEEKIN
jgi:hypothetical protein